MGNQQPWKLWQLCTKSCFLCVTLFVQSWTMCMQPNIKSLKIRTLQFSAHSFIYNVLVNIAVPMCMMYRYVAPIEQKHIYNEIQLMGNCCTDFIWQYFVSLCPANILYLHEKCISRVHFCSIHSSCCDKRKICRLDWYMVVANGNACRKGALYLVHTDAFLLNLIFFRMIASGFRHSI